jgi:hypothetical protein
VKAIASEVEHTYGSRRMARALSGAIGRGA